MANLGNNLSLTVQQTKLYQSAFLSQKGFFIWNPCTNIYRKGIREILLDCTPLEIEELKRTNQNLKITDVTRMKRKKKNDGKAIWVGTFSISITVRNKGLPNYVYLSLFSEDS